MSEYVFLFDLDATVTKAEILPELAKQVGKEEEMRELTERTMLGDIPFKSSFLSRVEMLKTIPVHQVAEMVENIPLNEKLVRFIRENRERCYIVTGNLDVWIARLMERIGVEPKHCFCSTTTVSDDKLVSVNSVIDKALVASQFVTPFVAIGDGSNDAELAAAADIGIGYGGVRPIAYSLLCNVNYAIYDENKLVEFLTGLL